MSRFMFLLLAVALVGVGCSKPSEPQDPVDAGKQQQPADPPADQKGQQSKTGKGSDLPVPTDSTRRSLAGRWILVLSFSIREREQRRDLPAMLLDVATADGKTYQAKVLASNISPDDLSLQAQEFTKDSASFTAEFHRGPDQTTLNFEGSLKEGIVWGNVLLGGQRCEPARLIPTESDSFGDFMEPRDAPGNDAMQEVLLVEENRFAEFTRFCEQHPDSPLTLDACQQMLFLAKREKVERAEVEKAAETYVKLAGRWGERMSQWTRILIGLILAQERYVPEVAVKYFDDAETRATDDFPEGWKLLIETGKSEAQTALAIRDIAKGTKKEQQQAAETLRSRLKDDSFNHLIFYALADYAERQKQVDDAIRRYAQLASLPRLSGMIRYELSQEGTEIPAPSETVAKLWEEKHGKNDGLEEYLNEVYKESIYSFADEKVKPRPADGGNRVVLCELFTGTKCAPCMAADVATGGLEAAYEKSDVIVLRYHVRIAGPDGADPLESEDSWARYPYYEPFGTPTTCVNGKQVENIGGPVLTYVKANYSRLREVIDPILAEKTDIKIKLTAAAKEGSLAISADVTGIDEQKLSDKLRLRLALAEDQIEYAAGNKIRFHEMVVRSMPGGADGIKPENGKLSYSETIKLADFKQRLVDYLADREEQVATVFPAKPLELKKLHLVAFIQDEDTREILQAAAVPVTGKLEYPAETKPTKPAPKQKADAKKPQPPKQPTLKLPPPKTKPAPAGKAKDDKKPAKPDTKPKPD